MAKKKTPNSRSVILKWRRKTDNYDMFVYQHGRVKHTGTIIINGSQIAETVTYRYGRPMDNRRKAVQWCLKKEKSYDKITEWLTKEDCQR